MALAMTLAVMLPWLSQARPLMTKTMLPQHVPQQQSRLFEKREMDLETPTDDGHSTTMFTTEPTAVQLEKREGLSAEDYMRSHSFATLAADGSLLKTVSPPDSSASGQYEEAKLNMNRGPALT